MYIFDFISQISLWWHKSIFSILKTAKLELKYQVSSLTFDCYCLFTDMLMIVRYVTCNWDQEISLQPTTTKYSANSTTISATNLTLSNLNLLTSTINLCLMKTKGAQRTKKIFTLMISIFKKNSPSRIFQEILFLTVLMVFLIYVARDRTQIFVTCTLFPWNRLASDQFSSNNNKVIYKRGDPERGRMSWEMERDSILCLVRFEIFILFVVSGFILIKKIKNFDRTLNYN